MERLFLHCPDDRCEAKFTRRYNLNRHFQRYHDGNPPVEKCFLCGQIFNSCQELNKHFQRSHKPTRKFVLVESAFRKAIINYRYTFPENSGVTFIQAQLNIKNLIQKTILIEAAKKTICKVSLVFIAQMSMIDLSGENISTQDIPFRSPAFNATASNTGNLTKNINMSLNFQAEALDNFINSGSNWRFDRPRVFCIEISALRPIVSGEDFEDDINISSIKNNKELFNPKDTKNKCFLYCIAHYLQENAKKSKKSKKNVKSQLRKVVRKFNTKDLKFPISIRGIEKFLKINPDLDIKINILYQKTNGDIFPFEFGLGKGKKIVNLLMIQRKKNDESAVNHFLLIKNVNKFLRKSYTDQKNKKQYQNAHFCLNCLNHFYNEKRLTQHQILCSLNKPRVEKIPENCEIKFKNYENTQKMEFIAYLDFECVLPSVKDICIVCQKMKCACEASYTDVLTKQKAIGYSFVVLNNNEEIIHEHSFYGEKANENFIQHILDEEQRWIKNMLSKSKPMVFTKNDERNFEKTQNCYMCGISFDGTVVKCRDHSHQTSEFLGAACQSCNLRKQRPKKLKIFAHNGSRYDFQFIVQALKRFGEKIENLSVLPYNGENFRTISFNSFDFVDSISFLQASLGSLADDLRESNHNFKILKQTYLTKTLGKFDKAKYDMVLQKSFFPYEYCESLDLMEKTKKIPKKSAFYSVLSEKTISKEEYKFAKKVWRKFKCQNLLDYTKLYCKIDTMLLCEVFESFRKAMMGFSGLDPAHYISLASYSYDSMLKMTKSVISSPPDIEMVHMIENGKRGGMSFIGTRDLIASTKKGEESEIVYIDANVSLKDFLSPKYFL